MKKRPTETQVLEKFLKAIEEAPGSKPRALLILLSELRKLLHRRQNTLLDGERVSK